MKTTNNNAKMVLASFAWDQSDEARFNGYHNPQQNWNGWAIPFFPKEEANKIIEHLKGTSTSMVWDGGTIVRSEQEWEDGDIDRIEPQTITVDDKEVTVYCIGGWEWTWSVVEKED